MSKQTEALKLALEALNGSQYRMNQYGYQAMETTIVANNEAITAIREALAEQPAPEPTTKQKVDAAVEQYAKTGNGRVLEAALGNIIINETLDKMAKNARELGLDYEPAQKDYKAFYDGKKWYSVEVEQPAQQQEPVVWMYVNKSTHETKFQKHMRDFVDHGLWAEVPLYGEPLANHELQCVCGAVWCGDEMVHLPDKKSPASKPLTDEEIDRIIAEDSWTCDVEGQNWKAAFIRIARAIEAKLREKNA